MKKWIKPGHDYYRQHKRHFSNDEATRGYRGLLLSTCQSVPLFSSCNNLPLSWRRGSTLHRKKLMYKTFYQRPVFRNQWSTFDAFTVMDCSQVGEKWHFFTSQPCPERHLTCTVRTNSCEGIVCKCCEEIRCLSRKSWLSLAPSKTPTEGNSGSLEIKNCTLASTESEYLTRCSGTCYPPDFQAIRQFANASCTTSPQICQRKIHQCQGLVCQCCDHVTCFLKEPRGMKLGFHDLHSEDLNILQLSDKFGHKSIGSTTKEDAVVEHHNNPRMVMDKVVGEVVPDVHNLFPISERFRNFQASSSALHPPLLLLLLHSELFFYLILLSH